ncbi:hypothetical protein [Mycobacterium sp. 141]|uniref:Rv1733c family protein n=1 Tax=Mycobacterium sp. 141 TaxID=1120797 RepID=UPI00036A3436|nr:hypothetical protein [Mycobacterium sp. 141]
MTDRVEAIAMLTVLATALLVVPTAAQSGADRYAAQMRTIAEQTRSQHQVDAVVTQGRVQGAQPYSADLPSVVQWREGSQIRTGRATFSTSTSTGQRVVIWLDNQGKVVAAPRHKADAQLSAFVQAAGVWLGAVTLSVLIAYLVRRLLDRIRANAWERELQLLAHNDDGWANRRI